METPRRLIECSTVSNTLKKTELNLGVVAEKHFKEAKFSETPKIRRLKSP